MMLALFDNTTSSDEAMNAVSQMREITDKQCFISGMTGVVTDIKKHQSSGTSDLHCDCCYDVLFGSGADFTIVPGSDPVFIQYRSCYTLQSGKQHFPR